MQHRSKNNDSFRHLSLIAVERQPFTKEQKNEFNIVKEKILNFTSARYGITQILTNKQIREYVLDRVVWKPK